MLAANCGTAGSEPMRTSDVEERSVVREEGKERGSRVGDGQVHVLGNLEPFVVRVRHRQARGRGGCSRLATHGL